MKNKFLTVILALVLCVSCALAFTACGNNDDNPPPVNTLQGRTFVFYDVWFEYNETISDEIKNNLEAFLTEENKEFLKGDSVTFVDEKTCLREKDTFDIILASVPANYEQNGNEVVLSYENGYVENGKIEGDLLTLYSPYPGEDYVGVIEVIVFKEGKKPDAGLVAGKTYSFDDWVWTYDGMPPSAEAVEQIMEKSSELWAANTNSFITFGLDGKVTLTLPESSIVKYGTYTQEGVFVTVKFTEMAGITDAAVMTPIPENEGKLKGALSTTTLSLYEDSGIENIQIIYTYK